MSQSPVAQSLGEKGSDLKGYEAAWSAVTRLMRRGWSWSGHERNCAFLNAGIGSDSNASRFAAAAAVCGLDFPDDGRAAARIDWDGDGDEDLFVTARSAPRLRFLRNKRDPASASSVSFRLVGANGNTGAVGARVELLLEREDAPKLVRSRRIGEGFLAQSSEWLHFGIGSEQALRVRVDWPSGATQIFEGPFPSDRWVLIEGHEAAREWRARETASAEDYALAVHEPTERGRLVLAREMPMPALAIELEDGRAAELFGIAADAPKPPGRVIALQTWASWCAPCRTELRVWAKAKGQLDEANISVIALSLDEQAERDTATDILNGFAWPHSRAFATRSSIEILEVMQAAVRDSEVRMPVPTTWLFNDVGYLVSIYFGPVSPQTVIADRALLHLDEAARLEAAQLYPGRWFLEPEGNGIEALAAAFRRQGLDEAAAELQRANIDVVDFEKLDFLLKVADARAGQGRMEEALESFQEAIKIDPSSFEARRGVGLAAHSLRRFDLAKAAYREAIRIRPTDATMRFQLGRVALSLKDPGLAQSQLRALNSVGSPLAQQLQAMIDGE
ncbi:MAG: tetratricopeptide (TPR) repeat protein [Planctomycetota bacterium]